MILNDTAIAAHEGFVTPYDPTMVQPASIDVRLDRYLLVHRRWWAWLRPWRPDRDSAKYFKAVDLVKRCRKMKLRPGDFILGSTYEHVALPDDICARFEGKSSLGRIGLMTHVTAGFIDPGFHGHITVELANVTRSPIVLMPGMKIGQLSFMQMCAPAAAPYGSAAAGSHYQGQRGPTPSRSHINFHRTDVSQEDS